MQSVTKILFQTGITFEKDHMKDARLRGKTEPEGCSKRILYIDNDPSICYLVQTSLELFTVWQVTTATGTQALEQAITELWDAVLLEIAAFDGDGPAIYDPFIQDLVTRQIPLLLFTTKVMRRDYQQYQQMAIAGVIAKPFDPVTLGVKIATLVGWELPRQFSSAQASTTPMPQQSYLPCSADLGNTANLIPEYIA